MQENLKERLLEIMALNNDFERRMINGKILEEKERFLFEVQFQNSNEKVPLPYKKEDEEECRLLHQMTKYPQHSYFELLYFKDLTEPILCMVFEKGTEKKALNALDDEVCKKYCEHYHLEKESEVELYVKEMWEKLNDKERNSKTSVL